MSYPRREKPRELLQLHPLAEDLFELLRETFDVPVAFELALHDVDGTDAPPAGDARVVAALAMREAQSLRRVATAGVCATSVDVVNVAVALHAAVDVLVGTPTAHEVASLLRGTRDQVNEAARLVASLGAGVEGGIVELC